MSLVVIVVVMHSYSSLLGAALLLCVLIPFAQNNNTSCNLRPATVDKIWFPNSCKEKDHVLWLFVTHGNSSLSKLINCNVQSGVFDPKFRAGKIKCGIGVRRCSFLKSKLIFLLPNTFMTAECRFVRWVSSIISWKSLCSCFLFFSPKLDPCTRV